MSMRYILRVKCKHAMSQGKKFTYHHYESDDFIIAPICADPAHTIDPSSVAIVADKEAPDE